ncbi:MAG: hypothetical protein AB1705_24750 [Verrucomicrobiota bacterium]
MAEVEFLRPEDKPALVAITTAEWQVVAQAVLAELGYKVHTVEEHKEFLSRYTQFPYQVVLIEECFAGTTQGDNLALAEVQIMPMNRRRHSTFILIGPSYVTMHVLQAYQQSVHAVINPADLADLGPMIQKVVGENELFYNSYRQTQQLMAEGKA